MPVGAGRLSITIVSVGSANSQGAGAELEC